MKKIILFSVFVLFSSNAFAANCSEADDRICGSSSNYLQCVATNADVSSYCQKYGQLVLQYPACQKYDNEKQTLECVDEITQRN